MPNSESFFGKSAPRGFAVTLFSGAMFVAALTTTHLVNFAGPSQNVTAHRAILVRLIDASGAAAPSAYDKESGMTRDQLLNRWDAFITEASQRFHVPKPWIRAVMARESGGRTMLGQGQPIVSRAGAVGLMQVLPATYDQMRAQQKLGDNPFDAHDNILAGAAYLRWLHGRYGFPAMFAAYNAGPGRLRDHMVHGSRLPAETRAYVGGITRVLNPRQGGDPVNLGADLVTLTRPDGAAVKIDAAMVTAVRAPLPGEYARSVKAVVSLGHRRQGICETVRVATAAIRATGGLL